MEDEKELLERYKKYKNNITLRKNIFLKIYKRYPEKISEIFKRKDEEEINDFLNMSIDYLLKETYENINVLKEEFQRSDNNIRENLIVIILIIYNNFRINDEDDFMINAFKTLYESKKDNWLCFLILYYHYFYNKEKILKIIAIIEKDKENKNYKKIINIIYWKILELCSPEIREEFEKVFLSVKNKKFVYKFISYINRYINESLDFYFDNKEKFDFKNINRGILKKIFSLKKLLKKIESNNEIEIKAQVNEIIRILDEEIKNIKEDYYYKWYGIFTQIRLFVYSANDKEWEILFKILKKKNYYVNIIVECFYHLYFSITYLSNDKEKIENNNEEDIKKFLFYNNDVESLKKNYFKYIFEKKYPDENSKKEIIIKIINQFYDSNKVKDIDYLKYFLLFNYLLSNNIQIEKEEIKKIEPTSFKNLLKKLSIDQLFKYDTNSYNIIEYYLLYLIKYNYLDKIKEFFEIFISVGSEISFTNYLFTILDEEFKQYFINNYEKFYSYSFKNFTLIILYYLDKDFIQIVENYANKINSIYLKSIAFYIKLYNEIIKFDNKLNYDQLLESRYYHWIKENLKFEILLICPNCGNFQLRYIDKIIINKRYKFTYINSSNIECKICKVNGCLLLSENEINKILFINLYNTFLNNLEMNKINNNILEERDEVLIFPFIGKVQDIFYLEKIFKNNNLSSEENLILRCFYFLYKENYYIFYWFQDFLNKLPFIEIKYGIYKFFELNQDYESINKILNTFYKDFKINYLENYFLTDIKIPFIKKIYNEFKRVFADYIKKTRLPVPENKCLCGSGKKYKNCCFNI